MQEGVAYSTRSVDWFDVAWDVQVVARLNG